jgi:hypothetical protein
VAAPVVCHDLAYTANVVEEQHRSALHTVTLPVCLLWNHVIHAQNPYFYSNEYAHGVADIVDI